MLDSVKTFVTVADEIKSFSDKRLKYFSCHKTDALPVFEYDADSFLVFICLGV